MLGLDEIARDVSSRINKSVKEIYSAGTPLTDNEEKEIHSYLEEFKKFSVNIVDQPGTVSNIKDTILYYCSINKLAEKKKGLIITLDHTLLVKREEGEDEKTTLDNLMHTLVALKKFLSSSGIRVIFFVLSQLNRNIETTERIVNPKLHYPNKNDLFGASSVYHSSDYVIILHRPCLIEGLGNWYGRAKPEYGFPDGLPVYNPQNKDQPMIYLHIIKERFGKPGIIAMLDDLAHSKITEYSLSD